LGTLAFKGGASIPTLISVRMLIATSLIGLTLISLTKLNKYRLSKLFKIEREDIKILMLSCFLLVSNLIVFWEGLASLNNIPMALGVYHTYPLWIAIMATLAFKERFGKIRLLALGLGSIGALFAIRFLPSLTLIDINIKGVLLMLAAAITFGGYMLTNQKLMKKYHYFTILFYNFLACLGVYSLMQSPSITLSQLTPDTIWYIVATGVVSTYIAYIAINIAIKKIRASNTSIISLSKPIIASILAFIVLGQTINYYQAFGIGCILLSIYLLGRRLLINEREAI